MANDGDVDLNTPPRTPPGVPSMPPPAAPPQMPPPGASDTSPPTGPATIAQLVQAVLLMVQQQNNANAATVAATAAAATAATPTTNDLYNSRPRNLRLDECQFRRIACFTNKADAWKEWQIHFVSAVRETSMQLAEAMLRAEAETVPIDTRQMDPNWAEALYLSPALHTRLLSLTSGVSFQVVNATNANGLEAWRLLAKKFNPTTPASCVSLMTQVINFRITKSEDVLAAIVRWESLLTTLSRDHKEELSEKMKIAFLLKASPTALGDRLMELMDRLVTYKGVHGKIVNLV